LTETDLFLDMTSYDQDGGRDVISREKCCHMLSAYVAESACCPLACRSIVPDP